MKPNQAKDGLSRRKFIKGVGATVVTLSATSTLIEHPAAAASLLGPMPPAKKDWTIMIYMAADDNLGDASRSAILQLKQVGSGKDFNVIAQFDNGSGGGATTRFFIRPLLGAEEINRKVQGLNTKPLKADFRKWLREPPANGEKGIFEELKKLDVEVELEADNKKTKSTLKLESFFKDVLVGPGVEQCFLKKLQTRNLQKLVKDPDNLKNDIINCLLAQDIDPKFPGGIGSTAAGNPLTLNDFIQFGIDHYPSDKKMVIIWGHGDGTSVAWDATPLKKHDDCHIDRLTGHELNQAFSLTNKSESIDIVGFNSCNMGLTEVYYQLRGLVGIGIASEGSTPNQSWPYANILNALQQRPSMRPEELASTIVSQYKIKYSDSGYEARCQNDPDCGDSDEECRNNCSIDLSASQLDLVDELVYQLGPLAISLNRLAKQKDVKLTEKLLSARHETQSYNNDQHVDLAHFCQKLIENFPQKEFPDALYEVLRQSCLKVIGIIKEMVFASVHKLLAQLSPPIKGLVPDSHGLSIYFPEDPFTRRYADSLEIKGILWTEFLRSYVKLKTDSEQSKANS